MGGWTTQKLGNAEFVSLLLSFAFGLFVPRDLGLVHAEVHQGEQLRDLRLALWMRVRHSELEAAVGERGGSAAELGAAPERGLWV